MGNLCGILWNNRILYIPNLIRKQLYVTNNQICWEFSSDQNWGMVATNGNRSCQTNTQTANKAVNLFFRVLHLADQSKS